MLFIDAVHSAHCYATHKIFVHYVEPSNKVKGKKIEIHLSSEPINFSLPATAIKFVF